jgi:alkanesulfonate monooxygenase SsuD/methylene tetrahydromethanopterin reductase-like flavin-dependent oxidoreductase (luciferase family)
MNDEKRRVPFGVVNALRSCREEMSIARACEAAGFWAIGLGDTAPRLYQDTYVTAAACLASTASLRAGPMVTNPVTRHWSVLAATVRTLDELHPGRCFIGMGTGDGAVHSVGLPAASWRRVEDDLASAQEMAGVEFDVHVAASGPRGAEAAGRVATDLVIGTGLEPAALAALGQRGRAARAASGRRDPLRTWAFVNTVLVDDEEAAVRVRRDLRGLANAYARFSFASTLDGKAVPEVWHDLLVERLAAYDFSFHIKAGANPNAQLFDDVPELQDYLVDRMLLIGTADRCAARLASVIAEGNLDGVWLAITPNQFEPEPHAMVTRAGAAFAHLMAVERH